MSGLNLNLTCISHRGGITNGSTECLSWSQNDSFHTSLPVEEGFHISFALMIAANVYICINILFTWLTNVSLITVISVSQNLKTPPNNHLINICVNNMFLSFCMVFSLLTLNMRNLPENTHKLFDSVQLFIVTNSFLQYWNCFSSIGYYRLRTIKKPSLTAKFRKEIIQKCITASWAISILLSLIFTLSSVESTSNPMLTLAPLRFHFDNQQPFIRSPSLKVVLMSIVILIAYLVNFVLIASFYYRVFLMFEVMGSVGKNRVVPLQHSSVTSETTDLTLPTRRMYKPMENNWMKPYTVSENFMVHYQKRDNAFDLEDVFALENPMVAASIQVRFQKRPLQQTVSNCSTSSTRSRNKTDFTDISPGAELQRSHNLKNKSALRNQVLKRDRVSLSRAMKNSLVMMVAFFVCSMPLFISSVPGIMSRLKPEERLTVLVFCRLLFYMNAPVYPTWYLFFSKRVRKCLTRFTENIVTICRHRK